jgi:hypothetical protein
MASSEVVSSDLFELRRIEFAVRRAELARHADPAIVADHIGSLFGRELPQH